MANHKSSEKRIRSTETKRTSNRYHAKTVRNTIKKQKAITNPEEAQKALPVVTSQLDKLAKKGVIHKNKAANIKSKLARNANKLAKAEQK